MWLGYNSKLCFDIVSQNQPIKYFKEENSAHKECLQEYYYNIFESFVKFNLKLLINQNIQESLSLACLSPTGLFLALPPWIFLFIQTVRNQLIFENRHITAQFTISNALSAAREQKLAQQDSGFPKRSFLPSFEQGPLPSLTVTCNTDAAWSKETGTTGLEWCFESLQPHISKCCSKSLLSVSSPITTKRKEKKQFASYSHPKSIGIGNRGRECVAELKRKREIERFPKLERLPLRHFFNVLFSILQLEKMI